MARSTRTKPLSIDFGYTWRRRRRKFRKMFLNHELLLTLLANDEIGKYINEIEKVVADFYVAGYSDGSSDQTRWIGSVITEALDNIDAKYGLVRKVDVAK